MRFKGFSCLLASALLTAVFAIAPSAHASPTAQRIRSCGQVITGPAYLDRDLTCSIGFVSHRVIDSGITPSLDLRGHSLHGTGKGTGINIAGDGVFFETMTVSNGRVDGWETGLWLAYGTLNMRNVIVDHNKEGLFCGGGNCIVKNSIFKSNTTGTTSNEAGLNMIGNTFIGNATASLASSSSVLSIQYLNNTFKGNKIAVNIGGNVSVTLTKNIFTANGVGVNAYSTSEDESNSSATIEQNIFAANGDGIYLALNSTDAGQFFLSSNTALVNKRYGIYAPGVTDLGGNRALANGHLCVGVVCNRL